MGAQTQFDLKNDRFIVNGSHEAKKLQDMLDIFIKKFVLCPGCDNPETVLQVHVKKATISQSCKACGYSGMLDMRHKLTTFILKNPPGLYLLFRSVRWPSLVGSLWHLTETGTSFNLFYRGQSGGAGSVVDGGEEGETG